MEERIIRVALATLGCKVNQYDTEAMLELLQDDGFAIVDFSQQAEVYLVNTCTVTQTSDKKSRQLLSRARSQNPEALIVAAGCYAQRLPENLLQNQGVDLVIGNANRHRIAQLIRQALGERQPKSMVTDIQKERLFEPLCAVRDEKTRAHLKIQEGCDRYCAYCIVPYVRGPVRSRPVADVRTELEKLADAGYTEAVLTGIHLMSYGKDLPGCATLLDAIRQVDTVAGIRRLRLGSLEPAMIDDDFARELARHEKVCRQFHLSLQSGCETVLQRMNRRYTPAEFEAAAERLRRFLPGCAITTDIIAGFPGETEEEHQQTLAFIRRVQFARTHVFPYSPRAGTKAAALPEQLPRSVKERRAHEIADLTRQQEQAFAASLQGTVQQVLLETPWEEGWEGYTDTYVRVKVRGEGGSNRIVDVQITDTKNEVAFGSIVLHN